jgi:hypothetical protein
MLVSCCVAQEADAGGAAVSLAFPLQNTDCTSLVEGGGGPGRCLTNGYGLLSHVCYERSSPSVPRGCERMV